MLPDARPYFSELADPRRETRNKLHKLQDIVMIVLCAVISGVEDWAGMEMFAEERESWLRGFLELPNGIPSHDTLSDVMGRLKPQAFAAAFTAWTTAALPALAGAHMAIDGKALRGSRQPDSHQPDGNAVHLIVHETVEKNHGRIETRRYAISDQIDWLEHKPQWASLKAAGMVGCVRETGQKVSVQRRYYLCSINDLERFAQVVRGHWAIENSQHWGLDVQFGEDASRSRKDHSASNLAMIRRMALNLLRNAEDSRLSIRRRKMRAGFNDDYRHKLIFGRKTEWRDCPAFAPCTAFPAPLLLPLPVRLPWCLVRHPPLPFSHRQHALQCLCMRDRLRSMRLPPFR